MKVVDLINKIAKGEELPKKIIIHTENGNKYEMVISGSGKNYKGENENFLFSSDYDWLGMLNYDVEIIEETKNLSKIKWEEKESLAGDINDKQKLEILARRTETLKKSLNEIIDKLNEVE